MPSPLLSLPLLFLFMEFMASELTLLLLSLLIVYHPWDLSSTWGWDSVVLFTATA